MQNTSAHCSKRAREPPSEAMQLLSAARAGYGVHPESSAHSGPPRAAPAPAVSGARRHHRPGPRRAALGPDRPHRPPLPTLLHCPLSTPPAFAHHVLGAELGHLKGLHGRERVGGLGVGDDAHTGHKRSSDQGERQREVRVAPRRAGLGSTICHSHHAVVMMRMVTRLVLN
jgi:hypothetical protein